MPPSAAPTSNPRLHRRIRARIRGAVQGVGFRPHVRILADKWSMAGWVANDGDGVILEAQGEDPKGFLDDLLASPPPLARIDSLEAEPANTNNAPVEVAFEIRESRSGPVSTSIIPDAAVCDACLEDLCSSSDRRHLYPFLNCTHCGPRFTLTKHLPYDRANTSMAAFEMCDSCQREYDDPDDRRFHAQPVACPDCGPRLSHSIEEIMSHLLTGDIIALKGIGGFHLVCDARNEEAINKLRTRKNRDAKPFAIMVANLASAENFVELTPTSESLLEDNARPIVLCPKRCSATLPEAIAPGLGALGVMLPYAPLHYLLFHHAAGAPEGTDWLKSRQDLALVMTSANPGGEPLTIANDEAEARLSDIADCIVTHDRDILIRADDSVMRVIDGAPAFIRRGRGHTPRPIQLPEAQPSTLAVGAHLKNTICVTRDDQAFVSQYIGDLDTPSGVSFMQETIAHFLHLVDVSPDIIACDRHPDFQSTLLAESWGKPLVRVQHHHAHIAAVAAEYGLAGPLLGLSLDGYGYGDAGEAWGGELILDEGATFTRMGHLAPLPLPGGEAAAREPWRMAAAALAKLDRADDIRTRFGDQPMANAVSRMLQSAAMTGTSSCGRLFDAAAGLLGVATRSRYEAEPAMLLESLVDAPYSCVGAWTLQDGILDFQPVLGRLADLKPENPAVQQAGANLFHGALIEGIAEWTLDATTRIGASEVALTGGCFLNKVLAEGVISALRRRGLTPLYPRQVPPGDGAISLGQALVAGQTPLEEMN